MTEMTHQMRRTRSQQGLNLPGPELGFYSLAVLAKDRITDFLIILFNDQGYSDAGLIVFISL